jgi:hypothetical protein
MYIYIYIYVADDNPLESVSAKIQEGERLGTHQYEFSGMLYDDDGYLI